MFVFSHNISTKRSRAICFFFTQTRFVFKLFLPINCEFKNYLNLYKHVKPIPYHHNSLFKVLQNAFEIYLKFKCKVELTRTISDCFSSNIWLLAKVLIEGNIASARAMLQMLGNSVAVHSHSVRDRQCVSNTFDWLPTCPIIRRV